jgi:hypothetical protein
MSKIDQQMKRCFLQSAGYVLWRSHASKKKMPPHPSPLPRGGEGVRSFMPSVNHRRGDVFTNRVEGRFSPLPVGDGGGLDYRCAFVPGRFSAGTPKTTRGTRVLPRRIRDAGFPPSRQDGIVSAPLPGTVCRANFRRRSATNSLYPETNQGKDMEKFKCSPSFPLFPSVNEFPPKIINHLS